MICMSTKVRMGNGSGGFGLSDWSSVEIGRADTGGEPRFRVGDDMGFGIEENRNIWA